MANVLDRIKQLAETETKVPSAAEKKAYSNMMVYLKELKLHNVKNLELAEQIFMLSENSVEKLNEMHEVLTEKLKSPSDEGEARELLERTESLQRQIGDLSVMLREVYNRQESGADESKLQEPAVTYEEFKEMQNVWKQFEQKMAVKFTSQENQIQDAIHTELSAQSESVSAAIKNEMYGFRTDIADALRDEVEGYKEDVKTRTEGYHAQVQAMAEESRKGFEDSLQNHELGIKKEVTAVQEMLELTLRDHYNSLLDEVMNVKKVVKGYTRTAMWASCLALIVLILDILILK